MRILPKQDVAFKPHAPYNTSVEGEGKQGKLIALKVIPAERTKDILMMNGFKQ